MALSLYNTLTRRVEPFAPLTPGKVSLYVCGPTVYDDPHIGHARSAYVFDVLRRWLARTHEVTFVRNVTDVDDKIIHKAQETGETPDAVAEKYLQSYHAMLERLGIMPPTHEPRATRHLDDMHEMIAKLCVDGIAYEAALPGARDKDVYFAVRRFAKYGQLSNRTLDDLQAGARVEPGEHKRDPLDFALWKAAKPGEPSWPSPWGAGRPGWHIECSAMSTKYLGDQFDIHGGGVDLVFPHHENEIAQAQAAGKPFAQYWIHNGLLTIDSQKMSKSLGNYLTVEQVLAQHPHPDYLKIFFLKTHYRSPIDYSPAKMDEAKKNWQEFTDFFQYYYQRYADNATPAAKGMKMNDTTKQRFHEAMDDDLNTPTALASLFDLVNLGKGYMGSSQPDPAIVKAVVETLLECGVLLGLFTQGFTPEPPQVLQKVQAKIAERSAARSAKNFALADQIRCELQADGFLLSDTAGGTLWRRKQ